MENYNQGGEESMKGEERTVMVPFAGTEIMVVDDGDRRPVPMKLFVEGIGLEWKHTYEFVAGDEVLKQGIRVTRIPTSGGVQEVTALDMRYIPLFLAKLNPSRYSHKPELQARLVKYQVECADVLYQYFTKGVAVNPYANMSRSELFRMLSESYAETERQEKMLETQRQTILRLGEARDAQTVVSIKLQGELLRTKAIADRFSPIGECPEGYYMRRGSYCRKPKRRQPDTQLARQLLLGITKTKDVAEE